jgi:hypothetical protein
MMDFQMEMTTVKIQDNNPGSAQRIATWNASLMLPLDVIDAPTLVKHSAVTVYRIVTVVVSSVHTVDRNR